MNVPVFRKAQIHLKGWGDELWLANTSQYCGKLLRFNKGAQFSTHFHGNKDETFYIVRGSIKFTHINPQTAAEASCFLSAGDVVDIPRLCSHRVEALDEALIFEISTHHEESDSYRVKPGDSQK